MSKLRSPYPTDFEDEESEPSAGPTGFVADESDTNFWWYLKFNEAMDRATKIANTIFVDIEVYANEIKQIKEWIADLSSSGKSIKIMYFPGDRYKGTSVDEELLAVMKFAAPLVSSEAWEGSKTILITSRLSGRSIDIEMPVIKVGTVAEPNDMAFRELEPFFDESLKAFLVGQMAEATRDPDVESSEREINHLKEKLAAMTKRAEAAEDYEESQVEFMYEQFIERGIAMIDASGKKHRLTSLYDIARAEGKPTGRAGLGAYVRAKTVDLLVKIGSIPSQP